MVQWLWTHESHGLHSQTVAELSHTRRHRRWFGHGIMLMDEVHALAGVTGRAKRGQNSRLGPMGSRCFWPRCKILLIAPE